MYVSTVTSSLLLSGLPCWRDDCGSSDAVSLYSEKEPHLYCFSCGNVTHNEELVDKYMTTDKKELATKEPKPAEPLKEPVGVIKALDDRGISQKTAERFNVKTLFDASKKRVGRAFPFTDAEGNVVAVKNKSLDKKMFCQGGLSRSVMFGRHLFPKGTKAVTITEGEEDAMAAYQMLSNDTYESACVSLKSGASSAERDCKQDYEWLNSFDEVVICFDMDEPGQKAAQRVARLFPGKAKIVKMEYKDANEYLKAGDVAKFRIAWHRAEKSTPKGILSFKDTWDDLTKEDSFTSVAYPWSGLNEQLFGLRTGELTVLKAPVKIGKTQVLRELSYHITENTDYSCGIIFLEESVKRITQGFLSLQLNKQIHRPDVTFTEKERQEAFEHFAEKEQLHIFDPRADRSVDSLFDKMMYFVKALGVKFIFLDHISMFAYSAGAVDERRFLDKFLADLSAFASTHDVHIFAVIHENDDGKTRGSRAPGQLCNVMLSLQRDKKNPDPVIANTTTIIIDDDRFTGAAGVGCKLYFDPDTGRMHEIDDEELEGDFDFDTPTDFDSI